MLGRSAVLLVIAAKLFAAVDELSAVREGEDALARAVSAKDKAVLSALTDQNFWVYWTAGSVARTFDAKIDREDWINSVIQLRIDSYETTVSKTDLVKRDEVIVNLDEFWTVYSPRGRRIEKHFVTRDTWLKRQGTWKLTGRISHSDLR
ncbi:MAG: hypothetical protein JO182_13425 [Acidobacteriaceae bacterium]|nr:hypothetical protein [Acidobacteriaceae bacterium]MBV9307807.1 hypothetical protein [Acidobacteriaceae bacterium]